MNIQENEDEYNETEIIIIEYINGRVGNKNGRIEIIIGQDV